VLRLKTTRRRIWLCEVACIHVEGGAISCVPSGANTVEQEGLDLIKEEQVGVDK